MSFSIPLPFDPIRRAAELWRARWGARSQFARDGVGDVCHARPAAAAGEFDATVGRHGLTFARYEALVLLAFSREGRLPMSKIGQRLMVHPTSATNIIQRLDAQGLVDRAPNPADGRGTLAAITPPAGRRWSRRPATWSTTASVWAPSPAAELEQLFRLLRKVRLEADDFTDDRSAGRPLDGEPRDVGP